MELKYNLTEKDYLNFNLFHMKNSKSANKALMIQRIFTPITLLLFGYVLSLISDIPLTISLPIFLLFAILWYIFFPKYFYSHVVKQVRKMTREGRNDDLLGEHILHISDEGLIDTTKNGETKVNWSGIKDFKEDQHHLYLYNSAVSAYILPKRDIPNVEELKSFIQSKISL
ncbi:YcxB family protein [Pseudoneobacillus sp. C159]